MKKKLVLLTPLLVTLIIAIILILINQRATSPWKTKLKQYLVYLRETEQISYQILDTASAVTPENFSESMSGESYSQDVTFASTHNLFNDYSSSLLPMPYPPDQVICVLLNLNGNPQLVYVALHNSLYNADWIVHVSPDPWGSPLLQENLKAIGCTLGT